ncbi:hypothetical protein B0A55_03835 [Friedmanniomyces simplex]|uniref:Uncharacterized protein n=1 Tax=Friedmanniomyces simplex TaxID=329884 RepID=A0A4U0XRG7_9PEZI|nr:hypothetical protein B0A55_03835 [Friedmanniomyces simplex]
MREEVGRLREQVRALDSALGNATDKTEEVDLEDGDAFDHPKDGGYTTLKREASASPSATSSGKNPALSPNFTFAPLMMTSDDGAHEFGRISEVSAAALQSI